MPFHVYMLASKRYGTLYIGVTNDLRRRLEEHRLGKGSDFVKKYGVTRLVYVESYDDPETAIAREKQLKKRGTGLEDSIDRRGKSRMAGFEPSDRLRRSVAQPRGHGVWVPAFAGTTTQ